jgi:hypothetical protein
MGHAPVLVHCLAGDGCEVIGFYAQKVGKEPFTTSILRDNLHLDDARLRRLQRQHWTAFKHATRHIRKARGLAEERDYEDLLAGFSDEQNDLSLRSAIGSPKKLVPRHHLIAARRTKAAPS